MLSIAPVAESPIPPMLDRIVAGLMVLIATGFVLFLLQAKPDGRGHGTHEQLGMAPCGWVIRYQKPCPTCGVTTAACHLVHLQIWDSVRTQPFGAALAGFGLWLAAVAIWCLVRGLSFGDYLFRLPQVRLAVWGVVLLLGSWVYTYTTFQP